MNKFICVIIFIVVFTNRSYSSSQHVWLNVFIHGTSRPYISTSDILKVRADRVENSRYETVTTNIRNNLPLHTSQVIQQQGFHSVDIKNPLSSSAALFCSLYEQISQKLNQHKQHSLYYTFGWSGLLSLRARRDASFDLFEHLNKICAELEKKGVKPHIRLVGYSHGGTIGLYLAEIAKQRNKKAHFHVDELILVGTPIQQDTDFLTRDPIFKKIINVFSEGDLVQPSDFVSTPFSITGERIFTSRKGFTVPSKVIQLNIKLIKKLEVKTCKDRCTGTTIKRADKINPGHIELWHFGWASAWYRPYLPIAPFPACLFIPFFEKILEKKQASGLYDIVLVPEDYIAYLHQGCSVQRVPFLTKEFMQDLKSQALAFKSTINRAENRCQIEEARKLGKSCFRKTMPRINPIINQQKIYASCGIQQFPNRKKLLYR